MLLNFESDMDHYPDTNNNNNNNNNPEFPISLLLCDLVAFLFLKFWNNNFGPKSLLV